MCTAAKRAAPLCYAGSLSLHLVISKSMHINDLHLVNGKLKSWTEKDSSFLVMGFFIT